MVALGWTAGLGWTDRRGWWRLGVEPATSPVGEAGCPGWPGPAQAVRSSRARRAVSEGVLPTRTPAASRASFLAWAVPEEPETMAPAWPMVLPSGAVKPAT